MFFLRRREPNLSFLIPLFQVYLKHNSKFTCGKVLANKYQFYQKEVLRQKSQSTDENADEELIYNFTKSFWENIGALQSSNTSFAGMSAELGSKMYDVPMHPGAARYFAEVGVN